MEASEIQISVNEDEDHKEEEDLNLDQDEKKDDEEKNDVLSVSEKEELEVANDTVGDSKQTFTGILIEHLPWLAVAMLGFILLLTAVILMTTGMISKPKINLESINIPSFQGSMRIHSIDNENLKYSAKLKYVGNLAAINLRHKIEPKVYMYL
ncbi:unnamed protein product [Clavelina lepadiformis]|uniref:Uncharacterized protein n=1 Tax=Clavelina lepadiformis TaxID=159417 RepID=A0ABP0G0X8_CLALP